jgi:DNA-binding MarR family transcriptional regulator/N-acetylglutamate synthase-like GNAT family acetyltransferase
MPAKPRSPGSAAQTFAAGLPAAVDRMRAFNRFYTHRIGVLEDGRLYAPFSLAETRVLYELAHRDRVTASDLVRDLGLDPGYLSRMLRSFEKKGLVRRRPAPEDARQSLLGLTAAGARAFAPTEAASRRVLRPLLARLDAPARGRVMAAMDTLEALLGDAPAEKPAITLRPHRPGDIGWVVAAHGRLYAQEYGWDISFEALVAEIAAKFLRDFDPACERCFIAEMDGTPVGSAFVVKQSKTVAKLRLVIIDPKARGRGLGHRLIAECIAFARASGYRKLVLWTNSVLLAARAVYVKAGFELVESEPHRSFGKDLVGENWELKL